MTILLRIYRALFDADLRLISVPFYESIQALDGVDEEEEEEEMETEEEGEASGS